MIADALMPTDLDRLQGTWKVTSLEVDGQKLPDAAFQGSKIVIKNAKFKSTAMSATYAGTIELDEAKKPKALDLLFSAGPEKGNRNLAIYKFDGETLTLCLATRGTKRPKRFATRAGSGLALETLERGGVARKASKEQAGVARRRAVAGGPATALEGEWAMVSAVFSGKPLDVRMVKWAKRTTRGDLTSVLAGPQVILKARFTVDDAKNPRTIDYVNLAGEHAGKSQAGIVELIGETLRICMSAPGQPRPSAFSSKKGDGRSCTTWRRMEKPGT